MTKTKPRNLTPTHGRPQCPSHLNAEARKEWEIVCDELDQMGTLTTADRGVIAIYCAAMARWIKAEKHLANGEIVDSPKTGVPMHSLWMTVSNTAQDRMIYLARELGLTPKARAAMKAQPKGDDDGADFADL